MPGKINSLKKVIALLVCLITYEITSAQGQNVYFLKNDGRKVSKRDSADYIRVVSTPDSVVELYDVKEYYPNGLLMLVGQSMHIENDLFDGQVVSFFPSGKRKEMITYKEGVITGDIYDYYPNGKLYTIKQFMPPVLPDKNQLADHYAIKACNDSTGKAMVIDGNGYYVIFGNDFKTIREKGKVVNTLRSGLWEGIAIFKSGIKNTEDTLYFKEHYTNGYLVDATSKDKSGKRYAYNNRTINPHYPGGDNAWYGFLKENLVYPISAKINHIQGRVFVNFVIEESGKLTDIKVIRDPGGGTAEESIRVLKLSPAWFPGLEYGKPVRISYTIPINFFFGAN